MIDPETHVQIRRYFCAEHWKIGTIANQLGIHKDAVRHAIESDRFHRGQTLRPSILDPYLEFVRQILDQHPRLRATRIYQMIRERGCPGSVVQLRRAVARLRPPAREAFLRLHTFPAEQAQVDWAHFGHVAVGRAKRALSCFVITLSYSRALYLEFFFDQTMENFLRGHVHAFQDWGGQPRVILYDNLRSAVLERRGNEIQLQPPFAGALRSLPFRRAPLSGPRRQPERSRGARHSLRPRFILGGPLLHHSGGMQSSGASVA